MEGVDAHRLRGQLVLADRHEAQAEARRHDEPRQPGHDEREHAHHVIDRYARVERRQRQAIAAARDPLEVRHEGAQHLVEAEHGDREVGALEAQARVADDHREQDGGGAARQRGKGPRPAGAGDEECARVGARTEEGDVAERDVAGETGDQVPRAGERDPHEHLLDRAHTVAASLI